MLRTVNLQENTFFLCRSKNVKLLLTVFMDKTKPSEQDLPKAHYYTNVNNSLALVITRGLTLLFCHTLTWGACPNLTRSQKLRPPKQ